MKKKRNQTLNWETRWIGI